MRTAVQLHRYLHVGDLILLPMETLHLIFFQLQTGLHILIIIPLEGEATKHETIPKGQALPAHNKSKPYRPFSSRCSLDCTFLAWSHGWVWTGVSSLKKGLLL